MALGQDLEMSSWERAVTLYLMVTALSSLNSSAENDPLLNTYCCHHHPAAKHNQGSLRFFLHERLRENCEGKNLFIVTSFFLRK